MALAITTPYRVSMALTLVALVGVLIFALLQLVAGSGCRSTELAVFPSPSTRLKAVVYERDCGTQADATTNVSLLVAADPSLPDTGNALVVTGRADPGFRGGPEVKVAWASDTLLRVRYGRGARVLSSGTRLQGVAIAPSALE